MSVRVEHGDSRDVLKTLADASVDSVVTDPPYALVSIVKRFANSPRNERTENTENPYGRTGRGFMGKRWDTGETAFAVEFWAEVWRVLKPGGHVAAFSGTRTYHRMVCAIEDAGFEIRDQIGWLYGSGFPKSHDVSKGIDRHNGDQRPVVGRETLSNDIRGGALLDVAHGVDRPAFERDVTSAASAAWEGWGTALKPAWEPIVLARKPLDGTVAANVLQHGTGALNIGACRVGFASDEDRAAAAAAAAEHRSCQTAERSFDGWGMKQQQLTAEDYAAGPGGKGRWPANILHDGSEEVIAAFPEQSGGGTPAHRNADKFRNTYGDFKGGETESGIGGSSGNAARFFYSAKADAEDRFGSKHPTVKPIDLIAYLCRLVTPPGGTVLDPFAGSGTTGAACMREGFDCILIEREAEYIPDIMARIELASAEGRHPAVIKHRNVDPAKARGEDLPMFAAPVSGAA